MLILSDLLSRFDQLDSDALFELVSDYYLYDEQEYVEQLKAYSHLEPALELSIQQLSSSLISVAMDNQKLPLLNQVLSEYQLNQNEGVQLLALAEGLLRIKSQETASRFMEDKILSGDWESHKQKSKHGTVNLATEGLSLLKSWLLTEEKTSFHHWLNAGRNSLAREAIKLLIVKLAGIFIKGATIQSALNKKQDNCTHCCSFDMLGESALTEQDADNYLENYLKAIEAIAEKKVPTINGQHSTEPSEPEHSISIKLSALTPKFQYQYHQPLQRSFLVRVEKLIRSAHAQSVAVTLDAEESDQLELTLEVFKHCLTLPGLKGWGNLGIAVQAYGYRAIPTILSLSQLAKEHGTSLTIRLVKGAYWDTEINKAQELGLSGYPVFTQKHATDLNYQACVQLLLELQLKGLVRGQFATHNAVSIATVYELAKSHDPDQNKLFPIEFQRLHGMGETVYQALSGYYKKGNVYYCRSYCPVGPYHELLPYLIRRILENGANQSFLHELTTSKDNLKQLSQLSYHGIVSYDRFRAEFPLPLDIYLPDLDGSLGCNINQPAQWKTLATACEPFLNKIYEVTSTLPENIESEVTTRPLFSPGDLDHRLGIAYCLTEVDQDALLQTLQTKTSWANLSAEQRIQHITVFAQKLETNKHELITLCVREACKTWQDAIADIKEAIDFCHYYCNQYKTLSTPHSLPSTANETNQLHYRPIGNFLCISPWNFPVAILVGQVVAALICGNRVIIKPAPQTLICGRVIFDLLRECGVPSDSLFFLTSNNELTADITANKGIDGIAFTGSLATALNIQRSLLAHRPYPVPLIAETSGLNCMITDDSILTEQMVKDVVLSAFGSAGQRCSALRVLFIHEAVFDISIQAISGVMDILTVGNPVSSDTDLGPIIDENAQSKLIEYVDLRKVQKKLLHQAPLPQYNGHFLPPTLIQLNHLAELDGEQFGPILLVIKYQSKDVQSVISEIENSEYALTLGIHSRDKHWVDYLCSQLSMGNIYVNRPMTGAQVGAQPFGGHKRSGNGFKAGGPNYLLQFVNEQCISENHAAIGGNTRLITQSPP